MRIKLKPVSEQVIVITGASSGIGLATAEAAFRRGAKLVLAARSEGTLQALVETIRTEGGQAIYVPTDVAESAQLEAVADAAITTFGRIDSWVNNAAVSIYGRLDEVTETDSRRLFDINFWGSVNGSLIALRYLKQTGGALINVGSEVSDAFLPLQGMYVASKHALKGFTDALRVEIQELDQTPVAITLVQPTAVDTPFPEHARNYMPREPMLPSPRIEPARVADAILDACEHATRDVRVGMMAVLNTITAKNMPSLSDKLAAKIGKTQMRDELPRDADGTLYKPGEAGRTHGRGSENALPANSPANPAGE
jgi:short-subunit dehydrogenase